MGREAPALVQVGRSRCGKEGFRCLSGVALMLPPVRQDDRVQPLPAADASPAHRLAGPLRDQEPATPMAGVERKLILL